MDCRSWIEKTIEETGEMVRKLRECGVTDELVLVVSPWAYTNYLPAWARVKKETGVDHVEESGVGLPNDVEAIVMQRHDYLRMFVNELQRSVMESDRKTKELS